MTGDVLIGEERNVTLRHEGKTYLGVPTGMTGGHHALKALTALRDQPGWIVQGNILKEWYFSDFIRNDGEVCLCGPFLKGTALDEILERKPEDSIPYISRLIRALLLLQERSIELFSFQSDGVLFLEDGGVFFFPPEIMHKIMDSRSQGYKIQAHELINHPYLKGEERASFTIAILLYRLITGKFPFSGATDGEIRDKMRNFDVLSPHLVRPEIKPAISESLEKSFGKSKTLTLHDWDRIVSSWITEGIYREIPSEERDALLARAKEQEEKSILSYRSRIFWEKNGKKVLLISAAVIVFGLIAGSFVKRALEPRSTKGFSEEQVINAFYTSINTLDHMTMQDCVIGGAGKQEINEAINLYVISKQTTAYEGKSYIVPADEWVKKGKPELNPPYFVHGVTDLKITRERGGPEPVFLATYTRWSRKEVGEGQPTDSTLSASTRIKDRLSLKQDKKDWVIFKIDRLESIPADG